MSSTDLIRAYFAQRYRPAFFVPLAMLLYAAGLLALRVPTTPARSLLGVVVAYTLVLAFRIRDDIADLAVDRERHPGRITVAVEDLSPLRIIAQGAPFLVAALVAMSQSRVSGLTILLALMVLLSVWYSVRESLRPSRLMNALVVLLKYPAIAFVAATVGASATRADSTPAVPIAAFIAIYLVACTYEVLHDRGLQT